jgi:hypothetical protein
VDLSEADLSQWEAWSLDELARRLEGVQATWYVIAGWALDLFAGHQTREHADLEIGVRADEFAAVQDAFRDFDLVVVGDSRIWPLNDATLAAHRQTWVRGSGGGSVARRRVSRAVGRRRVGARSRPADPDPDRTTGRALLLRNACPT